MRSTMHVTAAMLTVALTIGFAGQIRSVSAAPAQAKYANLAGHWGVDIIFACNGAIKGKNSCHVAQVSVQEVSITAKADGTFTFVEADLQQAIDPRAPSACGVSALSNNSQLNGQCVYSGVGAGYFATSQKSHVVGFWLKNETYRFRNGRLYHNPPQEGRYPMDTGVPARPSIFNTAAAARIFGFPHVPAGLSVRISVTHTP